MSSAVGPPEIEPVVSDLTHGSAFHVGVRDEFDKAFAKAVFDFFFCDCHVEYTSIKEVDR